MQLGINKQRVNIFKDEQNSNEAYFISNRMGKIMRILTNNLHEKNRAEIIVINQKKRTCITRN